MIKFKSVIKKGVKCPQCQKSFATSSSLKRHSSVHTGERPFSCKLCPWSFIKKSVLDTHIKFKHSDKRPFKCPRCSSSFKIRSILLAHIKAFHSGQREKPFDCEKCSKPFYSKPELLAHQATHSEDRPFPCESCNKSFKRRVNLRAHINRMHPKDDKTYECNFCNKIFRYKTALVAHLNVHTGEKPFKCDLCPNVSFTNNRSLKDHVLSRHSVGLRLTCDSCPKEFTTRSGLFIHKITIHNSGGTSNRFSCRFCQKTFKRLFLLNYHLKVHTLPHQCHICFKGYSTSPQLKEHIVRAHTKEVAGHCYFCRKSFLHIRTLNKHLSRHTKEKPYSCKFCDKCCSQAAELSLHIRGHLNECPYVCEFCSKAFVSKNRLVSHSNSKTCQKYRLKIVSD